MTTTAREETSTSVPGETVRRQYSTSTALGLAFIIVSPVIALFAILGMLVSADGPRAALGITAVLVGQIVICLSLAEMASKWPVQGGIYQWVVRTLGVRAGWVSGFLYVWTLTIGLASLSVASVGFVEIVSGVTFGKLTYLVVALAFIAAAVVLNVVGPTALKAVVAISVGIELIASVAISVALLFFHRSQPFSALFQSLPASEVTFTGGAAVLAVMAVAGWAFLGFESATDLAEEVREPRKALPIAMLGALLSIGFLVLLSYVAIVLSIPDYAAFAASGEDPAAYALAINFGPWAPMLFYALVLISFFAGSVGLVAGGARVIWSYAREDRFPFSRQLKVLRTSRSLPIPAMLAVAAIAAVVVGVSLANTVFTMMVGFVTFGFFQAMWLALFGRLYQLVRGRWEPAREGYHLGRLSTPMTVLAFAWCTFELVNVAWPRDTGSPWYIQWGVIIVFVVMTGLGAVLSTRFASGRAGSASSLTGFLRGPKEVPAAAEPA